jgi:hypothetical protein
MSRAPRHARTDRATHRPRRASAAAVPGHAGSVAHAERRNRR